MLDDTESPLVVTRGDFCYHGYIMAKQKKKRTKKYTGSDAAMSRPTITRVQAVNRSRVGQWWHEKKRVIKPILIVSAVVLLIVWLLIELIRIITNA